MKKLFFVLLLMFGLSGQFTVLNAQNAQYDDLNYGDPYQNSQLNKKHKPKPIPEVGTFIVPFLLFIIITIKTIRKNKQNQI